MIFEIKYATKYEQEGMVHQMDPLEELLKFVRIKAPLQKEFSPGVSVRPTENPGVWQLLIFDNWDDKIEGVDTPEAENE